jgi:hypothetical protein
VEDEDAAGVVRGLQQASDDRRLVDRDSGGLAVAAAIVGLAGSDPALERR